MPSIGQTLQSFTSNDDNDDYCIKNLNSLLFGRGVLYMRSLGTDGRRSGGGSPCELGILGADDPDYMKHVKKNIRTVPPNQQP